MIYAVSQMGLFLLMFVADVQPVFIISISGSETGFHILVAGRIHFATAMFV